jgi:hypothetical protein
MLSTSTTALSCCPEYAIVPRFCSVQYVTATDKEKEGQDQMSSFTAKSVAEWMLSELQRDKTLHQERAVSDIEIKFGKEFVYENERGNRAISKKVLWEFSQLTEGKAVWERYEKFWRLLDPGEYEGRLVE